MTIATQLSGKQIMGGRKKMVNSCKSNLYINTLLDYNKIYIFCVLKNGKNRDKTHQR